MIVLNTEQQAAVTAPDGPALVLAGAGTGKTRVIIERMAWLVEERGIDPRHLLALTFTNKAAAEMKQRLAQRLGDQRVGAWMGTFHAFGLFVLRREMARLGRKKQFTVFDDQDQLTLMKRLVKALPQRAFRVSPREALRYISNLKQRVETPQPSEVPDPEEQVYHLLWRRYHDALERASAVDFDDLLVLMARLFEEHPDVRDKYQRRYRYVLIDEYQDTNHAQYRIARSLAGEPGNIFAVGDEDQSIYGWRGADIRNILDFAQDFPEAVVHRLEENYRSTQPILDLANTVVAHNRERLGKTLRTAITEGEAVRFYHAATAEEEARWITGDIIASQSPAKEVAILYRTNAQARLLEQELRAKGLNYVVVGGVKFYQRKEVKDILAYLRLLVNPADDESLRRIINVPPRGFGGATMGHIEEYAAARQRPLFEVLRELDLDTSISARARSSAAAFVHLVDELAEKARHRALSTLVEDLLEAIGYRDYVQHADEKDFRSRLEVVDEFIVGCKQFEDEHSGRGTLADYLQELALQTDVDTWDPEAPAVTLMTCHNAKGLEFDNVYLVGLEEGLLPLVSEFEDDRSIEEERRLCYVAMTRARKRLTLTAARSRMVYGKRRDERDPSRFLTEAGAERLVTVHNDASDALPGKEHTGDTRPAESPHAFRSGVRVRHAKFGPGTVLFTRGSGDNMKARIRFRTGRSMMLMVSKAPLEIVEG